MATKFQETVGDIALFCQARLPYPLAHCVCGVSSLFVFIFFVLGVCVCVCVFVCVSVCCVCCVCCVCNCVVQKSHRQPRGQPHTFRRIDFDFSFCCGRGEEKKE